MRSHIVQERTFMCTHIIRGDVRSVVTQVSNRLGQSGRRDEEGSWFRRDEGGEEGGAEIGKHMAGWAKMDVCGAAAVAHVSQPPGTVRYRNVPMYDSYSVLLVHVHVPGDVHSRMKPAFSETLSK